MSDFLITYEDESGLEHHGIIGQKWGIRRYQNYDGSYTRAGMERYNKSKEKFDKYDAEYRERKKDGTLDAQTKYRRNMAKQQLKKDYKHLKQDKLGDQGKQLYAKGYRINDRKAQINKTTSVASLALAGSIFVKKNPEMHNLISNTVKIRPETLDNILYGIGGASIATLGAAQAVRVYDNRKDKQMRAYYGHTSNY